MPFSRRLCALLAVALYVSAAQGCRKTIRKTVIRSEPGIFTTDNFPGAPVQNGNVADDKRAMSPSNQSFQNMKITFNGDRGTALLSYTTASVAAFTTFCQFYDGETWTPPVVLAAVDVALGGFPGPIDVNRVCHAFLNTSGSDSKAMQDRDGDAIIFWAAPDVDSDGAGADGVNQCLFATYFDSSERHRPEQRYGFQEVAVRLNMEDEAAEDVTTFAILSDGVCGEARWTPTGNRYRYGDPTTGITVVWSQRENNDFAGGPDDATLHMVAFDLAADISPELPLPPGEDARLSQVTLGASDDLGSSEETQVSNVVLVTYNGTVFFRCAARNTFPGDETPSFIGFGTTTNSDVDETIQEITVDMATGTPSAPAHLSISSTIAATDAFDNRAQFLNEDGDFLVCNSAYGSDEGLANIVILTTQLVEQPLGSYFDPLANARLCLAEVDESTGAVISVGTVDVEDPDAPDLVFAEHVDTRISRNGDYIWIAWRELTDGALTDNLGLWVAQYITTRPDEEGAFTILPLADSLSPAVNVNVDVDAEDVRWFMFQDALGYVCGVQSDPDVMHVLYEQSDGTVDRILDVRLTAGLAAPVSPTVASPVVVEVFEQGEQNAASQTVHNEHTNVNAIDAGDSGDILCVYRRDIDPVASDFRLFATRLGSSPEIVEIDSASTNRQVPSQTIRLVATPPGSEIGRFDPATGDDSEDRPRPAEFVHVFFMEDAISEVDALGDALRTRWFDARDSSVALEESFRPSVGTEAAEPFELSLPFSTPSGANAPVLLGTAVHDNLVGAWFREENHIYYQECDPHAGQVGWRIGGDDDHGLSDPALVDDDSTEDVQFFTLFVSAPCSCQTLGGAMVFWTKTFEGSTVDARLQVRVRDRVDN